MNIKAPYFIMFFVLLIAGATFFGDQSYQKLQNLRVSLEQEISQNKSLRTSLKEDKKEVWNLVHNEEYLEKLARNRYALAKEDETVIFFRD